MGSAVAAKGTDSNSSGEMKSVRHNLEEEILEQLVRVVGAEIACRYGFRLSCVKTEGLRRGLPHA